MNRIALLAMAGAFAAVPPIARADISISPTGSGDALYLPYWSVQDDTSTLLSISNARDEAKAVRVNVVGGGDGAPLLSFNLYLAPHDSWSAALVAGGDGLPELSSDDASCVLPALDQVAPDDGEDDDDGDEDEDGDAPVGGDLSGAIEIVEMGTLADDATLDLADCAALAQAFEEGGDWAVDANAGLAAPGGGLNASAEVVDLQDATVAEFPATALQGFVARASHLPPAQSGLRLSEPLAATDGEELVVRFADGSTQAFTSGTEAIGALLSSQALHGDVHEETAIGASTRWLVAFPTLHALAGDGEGNEGAMPSPFVDGCATATAQAFDADGLEVGTTTLDLCAATQLLTFGPGGADGESPQVQFDAETGTALLTFATPGDDGEANTLAVPAIGYRISSYGPSLPEQANDRAREAVGASYLVVQPLARMLPQLEEPLPEEPAPLPPVGG